jgi:hypothetical protein
MSDPPPPAEQPAPGLPLPEALRTIGLSLEPLGVTEAQVAVTPSGITVTGSAAYGRHEYSWNLLAIRSSAQQESRGERAQAKQDAKLAGLTRWSVLLRLVGQVLEDDGVRECLIDATVADQDATPPWRVLVSVNGQPYLRTEDVQVHLLRLEQRSATQPPAPASDAPPRPPR